MEIELFEKRVTTFLYSSVNVNWRIAKYTPFSDVYSLRIELIGKS